MVIKDPDLFQAIFYKKGGNYIIGSNLISIAITYNMIDNYANPTLLIGKIYS